MKRFLAILLTLALSGCLTYDSYGYRDDGYYEDRYATEGTYHGRDRRYSVGYSYGAYPDYVLWSDYYSILWPVYRGYYDPFYTPGFYYGVTWYPHSYFGLGHSWYSWPYYHAYAPYRYSYWDGYYDRWDRRRHQYSGGGHGPYLFGSARNEAERLAAMSGGGRQYGRSSQPGVQFDPYAAQRTSPLARDAMRRYPDRGAAPGRFTGDPGRGALPGRMQMRERQVMPREDFGPRGAPVQRSMPRESSPARSPRYEREAMRTSPSRGAGWVSDVPRESGGGRADGRVLRSRPSPYYRDVAGTPVPINRAVPDRSAPGSVQGAGTRIVDLRAQRQTPDYRSMQRGYPDRGDRMPRSAPIERREVYAREAYAPQPRASEPRAAPRFEAAQPRYEAAQPRYEAPQRFQVEREVSRPERSEPSGGSSRDELRRTRDEN